MPGIIAISAILFLILIVYFAFLGIIFVVISCNLSRKSRYAPNTAIQRRKKTQSIIAFLIGLAFINPYGSIRGEMIFTELEKECSDLVWIISIKDKAYVYENEWRDGFELNGKKFVPLKIRDNYQYDTFDDINDGGVLMIKKSLSYHVLRDLKNDSCYHIYHIYLERIERHSSTTFVAEDDYDSIMEYYENADLEVTALWETAPENTQLRNMNTKLDLKIDNDEWMQLTHEMLDDTSKNESFTNISTGEGRQYSDEVMEFTVNSPDNIIATTLNVYIKDDKMDLIFNGYVLNDEIIEEHKDMFMSLIDDSQKELLQKSQTEEDLVNV